MTYFDFRLTRLSVEAFRGFRDRADFDLDGSAVIFSGPNGTGKTSVFDALQWVLLGSIERLEGLRARKTVEHVVSGYRAGERAQVSIDVLVGGREITVTRSGDYRESTLEVVGAEVRTLFGAAADEWLGSVLVPRERDALGLALSTCGLLQQDVMRSVLEAKPAARYAHISTVLGLSGLEDFEREAREAAKESAVRSRQALARFSEYERDVEAMATRMDALEQRALQRASVEVARRELERTLAQSAKIVQVEVPAVLDVDDAVERASWSRRLLSDLRSLVAGREDLAAAIQAATPLPHREDIIELESSAAAAQQAVETAQAEQSRMNDELVSAEATAHQVAQLAAAALPLLTNRCPVCDQAIDAAAVEGRLRDLADGGEDLVRLRRSSSGTATAVTAARQRLAEIETERRLLRDLERLWTDLRQRESDLSAVSSNLVSRERDLGLLRLSLDDLATIGPRAIEVLDRLASSLERFVDVVKESRSTGEIDRARAELESARASLQERRERSEQAAARAARMKQLAEAAAEGRVDVTTARFAAIEPLVEDIYGRLDPHPSFKGIGFEHDVYYGKGTSTPYVSDVVAGVNADPLIVFSASQANIAALSFFLAMSLGAGDRALPFVLLDDPLQSMDDVNVLGFADLCRFLRSERQLILSTHDRRFANLLQRKLVPRIERDRTVLYRFTAWDRRGPSVEKEVFEHEPHDSALRLLRASA